MYGMAGLACDGASGTQNAWMQRVRALSLRTVLVEGIIFLLVVFSSSVLYR
jgi:hypothetical protein